MIRPARPTLAEVPLADLSFSLSTLFPLALKAAMPRMHHTIVK
jgi:hypothetical protein